MFLLRRTYSIDTRTCIKSLYTTLCKRTYSNSTATDTTKDTTKWNDFITITSKAATLIPLEQLDLDQFQMLFPQDPNVKQFIPTLQKLQHGSYISYAIILIYLKQGKIDDAFQVYKQLSTKYLLKQFVPIQKYHLHILDMLRKIDSLNDQFEFQFLLLQLLGRTVDLSELLTLQEQLLKRDWGYKENLKLYRLFLQFYGLEFGREELVQDVMEEMISKGYTLGMEYSILFKTLCDNKQYESVVRLFDILKDQNNITKHSVNYLIKAYCAVGDLITATKVAQQYKDILSVKGWTSLIVGYCKSTRRRRMFQAESMIQELCDQGFKVDQAMYHAMLHGYAKKFVPRKFIEWYEKMIRDGYQPDHVTFSILQKLQTTYLYQPTTILDRDVKIVEWLEERIQECQGLDGDISSSARILTAVKRGMFPSFEELTNALDNPRLTKYPALWAGILSYMVKTSSSDIPQFLEFMKSRGVRFTSRIYSLMILNARKRKGVPRQGWQWLQTMIEDGIVADEYTYRNMISLAIKTSDFKRLYASIDTLFRRSIPVTKALLRDIVSMLARPKKFYVSSGLACAIRNRYPMGVPEEIEQWKSRQEKYDAIQQQYVALAIKVLEKQVEQAGVLRWYQLNLVLGACFVSADPELHFHAIESLLKKVSDRTSVVEFKKMVLESNYWPIIFKYLNPLNEFDFGLIKEYITTLGQIKDADTLYTIAYHVKNPKVLLVVMEQIGLHVRNEAMTRLVWDIVPEWTEELLWAKLRCLIWWGYHTEAIEEATVKYRDGTGFVVIELQKYLRSQGYDEKEQIVINYWTPRNPDWILEDAVF